MKNNKKFNDSHRYLSFYIYGIIEYRNEIMESILNLLLYDKAENQELHRIFNRERIENKIF